MRHFGVFFCFYFLWLKLMHVHFMHELSKTSLCLKISLKKYQSFFKCCCP